LGSIRPDAAVDGQGLLDKVAASKDDRDNPGTGS
jgi:hypothetical protein